MPPNEQDLKTAAEIGALKAYVEQQGKATSAIFEKLDDIQEYIHRVQSGLDLSMHKLREDITPLLGMMGIIQRHGDELRKLIEFRAELETVKARSDKMEADILRITESLTKISVKIGLITATSAFVGQYIIQWIILHFR